MVALMRDATSNTDAVPPDSLPDLFGQLQSNHALGEPGGGPDRDEKVPPVSPIEMVFERKHNRANICQGVIDMTLHGFKEFVK